MSASLSGTSGSTGVCDVLLFAEDPGAANYVAPLPEALAKRDLSTRLFSGGLAQTQFESLGVPFEPGLSSVGVANLVDEVSPRVVVSGTAENPDTPGLALIREARRRGIPTVGAVDGPAHPDRRFRGRGGGALDCAPDIILAPDVATADAYALQGHPRDAVVACGNPHYDRVRVEARRLIANGRAVLRGRLWPDAPPGRPVITFLAESSEGMDTAEYRRNASYTLVGRGTSERRTEIVLEEVLDALAGVDPRPWLVLRLHPKNAVAEFSPYLTAFGAVSRKEPPLEVLVATDGVVGLSSVMLVEAALVGTPALSVLPRPSETRRLSTIAMGLTPVVTAREPLGRALRDLAGGRLSAPDPQFVDRCLPPGAVERMADLVAGLARRRGARVARMQEHERDTG